MVVTPMEERCEVAMAEGWVSGQIFFKSVEVKYKLKMRVYVQE